MSRKSYFFETVKSKVIISLFETVRLSVSISQRNLYNSLKSIKENIFFLGQEQTENNRRLLLVHVVKINEGFFLHNIICS